MFFSLTSSNVYDAGSDFLKIIMINIGLRRSQTRVKAA